MSGRVDIVSASGAVISRSRNLARLRRYAGRYAVSRIAIDRLPGGRGLLRVEWAGEPQNGHFAGASCVVEFGDYAVLAAFVARWRNVRDAEIVTARTLRGFSRKRKERS